MSLLPYVVVVAVLLAGLYGVVTSRDLVHLIVCLSVAQSATFILLCTLAYRSGGVPPVVPPGEAARAADPVLQALALVDVVVSAAVTALLLAVAVEVRRRTGTLDPARLHALED